MSFSLTIESSLANDTFTSSLAFESSLGTTGSSEFTSLDLNSSSLIIQYIQRLQIVRN